jgi:DNA-binding transcriptional ArsR family regulator
LTSLKTETFAYLYIRGKAHADDIDNFVDNWHQGGTGLALHEFLGLSRDQYARWVENPNSLHSVRAARARQASNLLKYSSDPTRLQIILILSDGESQVRGEDLDVSPTTVSRHLASLRVAGMIGSRRQGKYKIYRLTENGKKLAKAVKMFLLVPDKPVHVGGHGPLGGSGGGRRRAAQTG